MSNKQRWVLQLCHGYGAPFDDVARQWKALFMQKEYRVLTVFLVGGSNQKVVDLLVGDVVFLDYSAKQLKGLKRGIIEKLKLLHKEYQFAFSIAHRYKPIYLATHLPNAPVIGVCHAFGVFSQFSRRCYINYRKNKVLALVGVSDAVRDDIRADLAGWEEGKVQTVHNRLDTKKVLGGLLGREEARSFLGLSQSALIISNVGRLHLDKDQSTLIAGFARIAAEVSNAQLVIIGEGRLRSQLQEKIDTLNLQNRVLLLGQVEGAWRYFKAFDLFVLSSHYEPFGMVLLEAMAASVPVICSQGGGAVEIIEDRERQFAVGDVDGLESCLKAFLRLTEDQRQAIVVDQSYQLQRFFSDEAVTEYFWNSSFIQSVE